MTSSVGPDGIWSVDPEWQGQPVFIIGGGPSVLECDLSLLRGRRVIVINTSYQVYPDADILFFGDASWWREHGRHLHSFKGRIVTVNRKVWREAQTSTRRRRLQGPPFLYLRRVVPNLIKEKGAIGPGLSTDRSRLVSNRTSFQGAINLGVHLGCGPIVTIGMDMTATGTRTHHHATHHWRAAPSDTTWDRQMEQLCLIVEPLRSLGIPVINASPRSRVPDEWGWPKMTLEQAVDTVEREESNVGRVDTGVGVGLPPHVQQGGGPGALRGSETPG